ncbi:MAG: tetratricopeptide repeat protein, partial [Methylobacterium sp.]|nr:tetratricopeptide repeat protein [Methylobacterium sp.]
MNKTRHLPRITAALIAAFLVFGNARAADNEPALSSEFVYKYLVGEVAGQRGEIGLASSLFYELAESSNNPALAERAARAAAYGNMQQLAIKAATLWAELDPASTEAHQAIAQMLISTGQLSDALP